MSSHESTGSDRITVVRPEGQIDIGNAGDFKARLQELLKRGETRVVIDLESVQYVDSAGLSALMAIVNVYRGAGAAIRLCTAQPAVLKIFALTRLDEYLPLATDLEAARQQLAVPVPA
jgi:anti-sigma B factor antagonist